MAGATGLEPAASCVTAQRLLVTNRKDAFVQFRPHRDLQVGHVGGRIVGFRNVVAGDC